MTHEDITSDLATNLPELYPASPDSGNYKLLEPIATYLDRTNTDVEDVDFASTIQDQMAADERIASGKTQIVRTDEVEYYNELVVDGTLIVRGAVAAVDIEVNGELRVDGGTVEVDEGFVIDRLFELGKLVDTPPNEGETAAHYRARLITEFAILSTEATISDILNTVAEIFGISTSDIEYSEPAGGERGTVQLGLPGPALDASELSEGEISRILDKLVAASYRVSGIRVGTFTYITPEAYNLNDHDPTLGYDGLDSNGDPKDNGGTYAGTI